MKHLPQNINQTGKTAIGAVIILVVFQSILVGCAATAARKPSGVTSSQEATNIWHSYEILPNYNYYYDGPDAQPSFIIGIDDRYDLTTKVWKPVDLTPAKLEDWINYIRPRVGYSPRLYGADITDSKGQRVGLWYSVRDWRILGSATVGENNQIAVIIPSRALGRKKNSFSCK